MPQDTKLLSDFQLKVLQDRGFFDAKREITEVIYRHFHELQKRIAEIWNSHPLKETNPGPAAKIFRGENYKGYPYVNLDFPRLFHAKKVFAYRTMCWWGHQFSFTLHLQGEAFEEHIGKIESNIAQLRGKEYFICVNPGPWEYHFGEDNYKSLDEVSGNNLKSLLPGQFIKLSRKLELKNYPELVDFGSETFEDLLRCIR